MADADVTSHLSLAEQLAEQFYNWEVRGRGWLVWDNPVELEPPFAPFFGHYAVRPHIEDDGRQHTVVSGALQWFHGLFGGGPRPTAPPATQSYEAAPREAVEPSPLTELEISVPASLVISKDAAEQFVLGLNSCTHCVSFEVLGLPSAVSIQLVAAAVDAEHVKQQLRALFPDVIIRARVASLEAHWRETAASETVIADMGLSREFMLPLAIPRSFSIDGLGGIVATLADVEVGELALLQVLFQPVRHPWAESILRSVTFSDASPLFDGVRDFVGQAKRKVGRPLYATVLRICSRSNDEERAWGLARRLVGGLAPLADPEGNELIPLSNDEYESSAHAEDLLMRRSRRSGMLLNSEELISLVHLPSASVREPKLRGSSKATASAPSVTRGHRLVLGVNEHVGERRAVTLNPEQRTKHMHLVGASGTGKSTLLLNMIAQDMINGDGVALLDPHGDLADAVLRLVPPHRVNDVILFDPSDDEFPIGFNVLSAHSAMEKDLLASDLVAVFHRLATSWGDQMNAVLGNAILAMLESDQGGTLVDLRRFLVEPSFRKSYLRTVRDPEVVYYWTKEFPLLTGRPQAPVLTRLDTFLRPKPIRYMVAQKESRLDFGNILDSGKILLARLSHGAIGAENANLLGALLVAKLHQLALSRQRQREEDRRHFWLYVDEFHQFATPSMAAILSGARKYRLGLILAHQELQQLDKVPDVASAVSNAYTRMCFRLSDQDARKLESGFSKFNAHDLQNLGTGEAVCRVERAELDFNIRTDMASTVADDEAEQIRTAIVRNTRERYAVPRADVEATLTRSRAEGEEDGDNASEKPARSRREGTVGMPTADVGKEQAAVSPPSPNGETASESIPVGAAQESQSADAGRFSGRGGTEHQRLQRLIKQWGEGMGYKATIEGQVLGVRAADVTLEKQGMSIACEICMTTGFVHELGNIRKCFDAGFSRVAAISPDAGRLRELRTIVEQQLEDNELERVMFCSPDEFFYLVEEMEGGTKPSEKTSRGYKVKTTFAAISPKEAQVREQQVSAAVARALRRLQRSE